VVEPTAVLDVPELVDGLEVAEVPAVLVVPALVEVVEAPLHAAVRMATLAAPTSKPARGERIRRFIWCSSQSS
jgi:hypothetical protein